MNTGILSIREVAEKYKFKFAGNCTCGGYVTEKYSNGPYTLAWRKTKYVFKLRKGNSTVKDWTPVKNLQAFMAEQFKHSDN